jgi:heme-degrading monooxygenase HmoA
MHARVSTYQTSEAAKLVDGFRSVTDQLEQVDGFSHAYFMVDEATGKALSITIWESQAALDASASSADDLRRRGTEASGTTIESVQHYAVPLVIGMPIRA